jgi:aspartate 1-decarboxylase
MNYLTRKKASLFLPMVCFIGIVSLMTTITIYGVIAQTQPKTATNPNFTGVWKLNLTESKLSDGKPFGPTRNYKAVTLTLIHVEPEIAVSYDIKDTRPGGDRIQSYLLTTDGKERQLILGGGAAVAWTKREGNSLIIYHKRATGADSHTATRRAFTISEDGKMLKSVPTFTIRNNGKDRPDEGGETEVWEKQ